MSSSTPGCDAATPQYVGKQHVRNGVITIDTEKTGMRVTIPILPELQATLDAGQPETWRLSATPRTATR